MMGPQPAWAVEAYDSGLEPPDYCHQIVSGFGKSMNCPLNSQFQILGMMCDESRSVGAVHASRFGSFKAEGVES